MAKQIGGIMGGFIGRLGPVIGYRRGATWCMRARPLHVHNPQTERQMEHRYAFREQVRLAARMGWPLDLCLTDEARRRHMTCRNLFMQMNQSCFAFSNNELKVDYTRLQLSTGTAAPVAVQGASMEENGVLAVAFDRNPLRGRCSGTDEVFLYAYSPALGQGYLFNPVYRYTGEVRVLLPEWLYTDDLQLFLMVKDAKGRWSSTAHSVVGEESGEWRVENGEWRTERGERKTEKMQIRLQNSNNFCNFANHFTTVPMEKIYIETYGCQMNFADSEVVGAILREAGYGLAEALDEADWVLINTCAIRDNAEQRVRHRVRELRAQQTRRRRLRIGVLGCMAERLQSRLMEEEDNVSFVCGPDAYRWLPELLQQVRQGQKAAEVELSTTETYADIEPVRLGAGGISAYISIMRGCQNYCTYCVVPYTRGRERSRDPQTIVAEARHLFDQGYREVTLLGQNVNSYHWTVDGGQESVGFPELMAMVAEVDPRLRVRFATSHPKDLSDELLRVMAAHDNICRCIHLPVQSGSDRMLKAMNRKYTVEWYLGRVEAIRRYLPDCSITTDVIAGFCGETLEDHEATLELFRKVRYDYAFMFKYSEREGTYAQRHMADDIDEAEKTRRLNEIIALQGQIALENNRLEVGREYEVLVEGESHRSKEQLFGRNSQNKVLVFDRVPASGGGAAVPGTYRTVRVTDCTAATLLGELVQ